MTDCCICDRPIQRSDAWVLTRHRNSEKGVGAAHKACTADGTERWCRLGQPHSDPLTAARRDGWAWGSEGRFARPGHTAERRLADARAGRLKHAPDPIPG